MQGRYGKVRTGSGLPALFLLLVVLLVIVVPARPGRTADEPELRRPVEAFFAGFEAGSEEAALASWAEESPYLAATRRFLSEQFKAFAERRIRNLQWVRTWEDAQGAWLRVTFNLETRAANSDKPDLSPTTQRRTFQLVSQPEGWRIGRYVAAERALAETWLRATGAEAREALLRADADLVSPELFRQLRVYARELAAKQSPEQQVESLSIIVALAEKQKNPTEIARTLVSRGILLNQQKRSDAAAADFSRAANLFETLGEVENHAVARFNLGMAHVARSRPREALAEFEASSAGAVAAGAKGRQAVAQYWIGYARHALLDHAGALTAYQASGELYRELKDGPGEARSLQSAGDVLKVLRRDREAIPAWERAADLFRDARMPREEVEALASLGITQGALGNYVAAYQAQSRRLKVALTLGDPRVQADSLSSLALTLGVLGQIKEAARFLEFELPLRRKINDAAGEANALRELGDAYRDLFRYVEAADSYQKALEVARRIPDREHEARALAGLARLQGERGDYLKAADTGEQAVRRFRELALKTREADALRELGKQLRAQGRHAEALAQFQASLQLDQEVEDLLGVARDLDETAQDHLLTGRFQDALTIYQTSLKVYKTANLRLGEADIHNKLGAALQRLGRYTDAEAAFRKSYELSEELKIEAGQQQARANLSGLYVTTGRYAEAIVGYEEALTAFRKMNARSAEATTLTNLGKVYASKGDLVRALEYHEAALKIFRELNDVRSTAQELHNIADVNADRARYAEALAGFTEALKVFRAAGLRLDEANTLSAQAGVYRLLGRPVEALPLYEQSRQLRIQMGDRPGLARTIASIGGLHLEARRHTEALRAYEESLATVRALGEKPTEISILNNLGLTLRSLGRPAAARRYLGEALTVARALGERAAEANALGNIAFLYQMERKPDDAERTYREALKLAEEQGLPEIAFRSRFGLGLVLRGRKQWRASAQELARATGLIDQIRSNVREQSLQTSFLEQYVSPFHLLADSLLAAGEPAAAYLAGERARARSLVDVLQNGKVSVSREMTPAERETEEKLGSRVSALSAELREARFLPTDERLAREEQLTETRGALEQFRRQLFLTRPKLRAQRGRFTPPTLTQLNRELFARSPELCILSYLVGHGETLLFTITSGPVSNGPATLRVYRVPVPRQALREQVETFWGECSRADGQYRAPGLKLFRELLQPAARDLAGKSQLIVVPDGPLHMLPFQALVDPAGKHLVERAALSYAPSVSALVAMAQLGDRRRTERPDAASRLLAFGRPKVEGGLSDLPATETEVHSLSRLFKAGAVVATGPEASEKRFKQAAARARVLHLATHGLVNEAAPMYSALALTPGEGEDGRLEARELLEMDLQAGLVVLSACETALGKTVAGEGVLGLTWSLFVAGAPSTVVSHWQVEDETTGALMTRFYRGMLAPPATGKPSGKAVATRKPPLAPPVSPLSKGPALRAAQLGVMRDGKHAHPYYWAPFILVGDWRGGLN